MVRAVLSIVVIVFGLAGCAATQQRAQDDTGAFVSRSYDLREFNFSLSADMTVSENDGYYPIADIVWRGDPPGPRKEQIAAMFETAASRAGQVIDGDVPVAVDVQLVRFHGVTDRTRYSVGGVYNVVFLMTVRDAASGAVIEPARRIAANLDAPGGNRAVELEQSGQTQKVRVTDFLTTVLRSELL